MAILDVHGLNKMYGTGPDAHIALSNVDLTRSSDSSEW